MGRSTQWTVRPSDQDIGAYGILADILVFVVGFLVFIYPCIYA